MAHNDARSVFGRRRASTSALAAAAALAIAEFLFRERAEEKKKTRKKQIDALSLTTASRTPFFPTRNLTVPHPALTPGSACNLCVVT